MAPSSPTASDRARMSLKPELRTTIRFLPTSTIRMGRERKCVSHGLSHLWGSRFELLFRKQLLITGGFCPQVGSSVLWLEFLEKG